MSLDARLRAAERLAERLSADPDLDPDVALELQAVVAGHIEALRAQLAAEAASRAATTAEVIDELVARRTPVPPEEVAAPEPEPPPAPPQPEAPPRKPRGPSIWARLGPAFAENLLFTLAVFLMAGGAVFFVTTAWTTMTGVGRLLVVFAGLEAFGGLLYAAGRLLNRGGTLPEVERTLLVVAGLLVPVAGIVAGELLAHAWLPGVVALGVALPSGWFAARAAARIEAPALHPGLSLALTTSAALGAVVPWLGAIAGLVAVLTGAALVSATPPILRPALPAMQRHGIPAFVALAMLAFGAFALSASAALHAEGLGAVRFAGLGVVLATVGLALVRTEDALARAQTFARPSSLALLGGLALALTGVAVAMSDPRLLLAACAAATWTALVVAFRLERAALLWPALALSAVTYLLLPAPVRELAAQVRAWFAGQLGYAPERLPLSFYGITFLPYTAALALFAHTLRQRGRDAFARVALAWTLAVATGLALLSITAGSDARAPMAVLGAEGALLVALGVATQRQRLVFAGTLGGIGSVVAALVHQEPPRGTTLLVLAALGLLLLLVACVLQRRSEPSTFARRASHGVLDAVATLALGVFAFSLLPPTERLAALRAVDAPGHLALGLLLAGVGAAFALAWLEPLAWIAVGFAGLGLCGGDASALHLPSTGLACVLLSILPLLRAAFVRWRPALDRPHAWREKAPVPAASVVSVFVVQALAAPAVIQQLAVSLDSWVLAQTFALAAVILAATAVWSGFAVVSVPACVLVAGSALAAATALGYGLEGMCGAATFAVAALALALTATGSNPYPRAQAALRPTAAAALVALAIALLWAVAQRATTGFTTPPRPDAVAFLLATAMALAAGSLVQRIGPALRTTAAGLLTATVPLLAIASCDALAARAAWYPLAVIAGACAVRIAAPRHGATAAALHLTFALVLAGSFAATGLTGDWLLATVFALFAVVARLALAPLPRVRSLFVLVGGLGALWVGTATALALPDRSWLPAVVLAYVAAATFAPMVPLLGIEARGTALFVKPLAGLALVLGLTHALLALGTGEFPLRDPFVRGPAIDAMAAALAILGVALGVHARGARRALFPAVAAALAAFVTAPLSERLARPGVLAWPDLEVALVAFVVACFATRIDDGAKASPATPRAALAYSLALAALGLTRADVLDLTTPLTCGVVALAPLALLWRERQSAHGEAFGWALLLAAFSTSLHLMLPLDRRHEGLLPLAAVALAIAGLAEGVRRRLARSASGLAHDLAKAAVRLTLACVELGLALVTVNVLALAHVAADAGFLVCGIATSLGALLLLVGHARREDRVWSLHGAVFAGVLTYAFLARRTASLAGFEGYHLQVVTVLGLGLLMVTRGARPRFARTLAHAALALPIPGVVVGLATSPWNAAFALFVASSVYGIAGLVLAQRGITWFAAALLNGALFALWRHHGIVDPAFHGVPAGLTLLAGSELAQRAGARATLFVLGLVTLYGSMAVQVARVEAPGHALALFVAGLAAVALGFVRRRNDWLLAGTAAVVVDVIAYLARHGLERDFVGAALLVGSGLTVLAAAVAARRRRGATGPRG